MDRDYACEVREIAPEQFRDVLGHLPTGVTVMAALAPHGPVGMAANSVTSVSLHPPLVLVCPAQASTTWPRIREAGRFCLNVMAREQADLARRFSTLGLDRFEDVPWRARPSGPGLEGALAWIECTIRDEYDAGDHTVVIATVDGLEASGEGEPLVFFRGRYGTFSPAGRLSSDGAAGPE
jgi:3-hydroxy-9,10-secoandrosta-1,3,5(10)-triene-9,17-dione monooxygenase reductase component